MTDVTDARDARLAQLAEDMRDVKSTMRELAAAMVQLAKIEERQAHAMRELNEARDRDTDFERRLTALESKIPALAQQGSHTQLWIDRAVWGAAAAALGWFAAGMPGT